MQDSWNALLVSVDAELAEAVGTYLNLSASKTHPKPNDDAQKLHLVFSLLFFLDEKDEIGEATIEQKSVRLYICHDFENVEAMLIS